jgi:hypothetical protein
VVQTFSKIKEIEMREQSVINEEIAKLKEMKPTVLKSSAFGDNHHDAIDAQIDVLEGSLSRDDIYAHYGDEDTDEFAQNVLDSALEAFDWRFEYNEQAAPTEGWKDLVRA